jgi:uncharacterized protein YbaR (Trm112 family)
MYMDAYTIRLQVLTKPITQGCLWGFTETSTNYKEGLLVCRLHLAAYVF